MMCATMSDSSVDGGRDGASAGDGTAGEVLGNLPRTRPQRPSARRVHRDADNGDGGTAARPTAKRATAPRAAPAKKARAATPRKAASTTAKRKSAGASDRSGAPQGFEAEASGGVQPPTASDVLDSAIGAAGDLVHGGLDLGERAVRGALSRLLGR